MRSLSDHIDLLSRNTKTIKSVALHCSTPNDSSGPFTRAILQSHLGNLIRDVDPSELGLFTLVQPERLAIQDNNLAPSTLEIERANFNGATPLKRPNARHQDASRLRDPDPEVYAEAALKYMDRYKLVRPMPRAQAQVQAILERVPIIRQSIEDLTDSLHNLEQTRSSEEPDFRTQLEEEERRIKDLRSKLTELSNRRSVLTKPRKSHLDLVENRSLGHKSPATSQPNFDEDEFWSTPAASTRTLRFSDNLLMEENVDLGNVSAVSFSASPMVPKTAGTLFTEDIPEVLTKSLEKTGRRLLQDQVPTSIQDEGILTKHSHESLGSPSIALDPTLTPALENTCSVSGPGQFPPGYQTPGRGLREEVPDDYVHSIIITKTVELIMDKLWIVMSDLVIAAATATRNIELHEKPSTRDAIGYLESMEQVTPADNFSATATNNTPSSQQVLTAALLIGLLSSPAEYSLPLNKVKELLAARLGNSIESKTNPSQQNSSRIVYGCVAKRLLRIDRTGGEQIVMFDV